MMVAYFKEYRSLAKAGLLRASHQMIIISSLFMFVFGIYLGGSLEVLIFILTPIGYMLDMDANKYVINYSMPICMKRRLHMLYYITVIGDFLAVAMVHLRYYIEGEYRSITLSSMIFMINLVGCSLYYYLFCSPEFKKDILDEDKKQLTYQCTIGAMIGIGVAVRLRHGVSYQIDHYINELGYVQSVILLLILFVFTLWWMSYSMQKLENTVRGH